MNYSREVLIQKHGFVGSIILNRPRQHNVLSLDMIGEIHRALEEWEQQEEVALVVLESSGEKSFCAGGDVRALVEHRRPERIQLASQYFAAEYRLNLLLHHYSKPIVAMMHGNVMGGGVGLSIGCSHRIVNDHTRWAMPEMKIGFFPDVGSSYYLSRMANHAGRYLALTSITIRGEDAIHVKAADTYVPVEKWSALKEELLSMAPGNPETASEIDRVIGRFAQMPPPSTIIAPFNRQIADHFGHQRMEDILHSLEQAAVQNDPWAAQTLETLKQLSPTSQKVALRQMIQGEQQTIEECFAMEHTISLRFMTFNDFEEGVKSVLIDKKKKPQWSPAAYDEVTDDLVESFFTDR